jgi:hypothetical protein
MDGISEASRAEMANGAGTKDDWGKTRFGQVPPLPLKLWADVLTYGAQKYSPGNWLNGMDWSRVYDALIRHLNAFWAGEENDPETGKSHLAHAMCCIGFLLQYQHTHRDWDDRLNWGERQKVQPNPVPPPGVDLARVMMGLPQTGSPSLMGAR